MFSLKSKYKKNPSLLLKYGFLPYCDCDSTDAYLYALPITLNTDGNIYKYHVSSLEQIYKKQPESAAEFSESGITFTESGNLIITPELQSQLTSAQLCVAFDSDDDRGVLFINIPDGLQVYYSNNDIKQNCPDIINTLLSDGVIYAKRNIKH